MAAEKDWIAATKAGAKDLYLAHESKGPQGTPDDVAKFAIFVIDLCDEINRRDAELKINFDKRLNTLKAEIDKKLTMG